jgi:outer membrane PBP1 activator LpoA protein
MLGKTFPRHRRFRAMPGLLNLAACLGLAAALYACTGSSIPRLGPGEADQNAQELMARGEPEAAAEEFLRLAANSGPESYQYTLRAAEAYIEAGRAVEAQRLLESAEVPETEPDWSGWRTVLLARVALMQNDGARALTLLQSVQTGSVSAAIERQAHHERARAYSALGRGLEAAREYIEEAGFLSEQDALDENARATWAAVNQLDTAALSRELSGLSGDLRGWVDLALIGRSRWLDNAAFERALAEWQGRYPSHPAGGSVLPTLAARPPTTDLGPRRIGLLLPLTGQHAAAARAIQDGFIAAWYEDRGGDPERAVVVYDADASNVQAVYDQAVDEGADFIVGPLEKPAIQTLLKRGSLPVPTLALNQIDSAVPARIDSDNAVAAGAPEAGGAGPGPVPAVYQFALSPEDEARQIAGRAWLEGRERALVIAPEGPWGTRVVGAFKRHWEALGGRIAAYKTFPSATRDYASAVHALVAASGRATAVPGGAPDNPGAGIDFVFMVATPLEGRQIHPQLTQEAGDLPTYATSHVYSGSRATEADQDLDGVMFPDMPWILTPERVSMRQVIARHFAETLREQPRLLAFGVDAYGLVSRLAGLQMDPVRGYEGVTGTLHVDGAGRIQRNLVWGRFSAGAPVLLEP